MGLTRKGFEAWVRAKATDEVVGRRNKERSCPLATYLKEQGFPRAEVGGLTYCLDHQREGFTLHPLRQWATRFVRYVDMATCAPIPFSTEEPVTAEEARSILRRV